MANYRSEKTTRIPIRIGKFDKPISEVIVDQRGFINNHGFENNRRYGGLVEEFSRDEDHTLKDLETQRNSKYVRQNRAIESTVHNVINRDLIRGSSKDYSNPSNGFDLYSHEKDRFPGSNFQNEENGNWDSEFHDQKNYFDESENGDMNLEEFLDELTRKRVNGELDNLRSGTRLRQGRRRKLTSQEQGILLVEALRKKRNFTYVNDHRGHGSDIQSGIMDMLGKSTCTKLSQLML